jgi:hypothetical protein
MLNTNALPCLARFWLVKLDSHAEMASSLSLAECVERITVILDSDSRLQSIQAECAELWQAAKNAQDIKESLSAAFTSRNGLVVPVIPANGKASEIAEQKQLRELSDTSVGKALVAMLDRVIELRA